MEGVVADVFLQAFGGAGTVGQVAQDDGDDARGVVDDFGGWIMGSVLLIISISGAKISLFIHTSKFFW